MANAYALARTVEAQGLAILLPLVRERAHEGQFVLLDKGPLARELQETVGDLLFNVDEKRFWSVEFKIEKENRTGNLFLESFSNKNLDGKADHFTWGSNPGWMFKLKSELMFYYFLDTDDLYVIDLFKLQRWAFAHESGHWRISEFKERRQGKYVQQNDTWGWCVPIVRLERELGPSGIKHLNPMQVDLFDNALEPAA